MYQAPPGTNLELETRFRRWATGGLPVHKGACLPDDPRVAAGQPSTGSVPTAQPQQQQQHLHAFLLHQQHERHGEILSSFLERIAPDPKIQTRSRQVRLQRPSPARSFPQHRPASSWPNPKSPPNPLHPLENREEAACLLRESASLDHRRLEFQRLEQLHYHRRQISLLEALVQLTPPRPPQPLRPLRPHRLPQPPLPKPEPTEATKDFWVLEILAVELMSPQQST